jgi:hypothetical protein
MARRIPIQVYENPAKIEIKPGKPPGFSDVYVMPSEERIKEAVELTDLTKVKPVKMVELDQINARIRVCPVYTRPNIKGEFDLKNEDVPILAFDWDNPKADPNESDVMAALETQPKGMTVDPNYGLGLKKEYRFILNAVAETIGDRSVLYIGEKEPLADEFRLPLSEFQKLVSEIDRIDGRAQTAENEVKSTTAYNVVAQIAGLDPRPFSLGRNRIRQIIQDYASDPDFRDPDEQAALVTEIGRSARAFATRAPEAAEKLVSDVQLTRLELAIVEYEAMMSKTLDENDWQGFFEKEPFLLSFAFGYPVTFVNGQSYVGGRRIDGKGEKISDFLFKNSLSNDAAIVEIKKPQTPMLKEYRNGVFAPHAELSGGTAQVLDQRYRLTANFAQHARDNKWSGNSALEDYEIDCVLVIGLMPTDDDQRRSFQLFRKNSHGVKIVTFDEILQQLKQIHEFLLESKPTGANDTKINTKAIAKPKGSKTIEK